MAHEFRAYEYMFIGDIERYPFIESDSEYNKWNNDKDRRDFLIALDRYSHSLTCDHFIIKIESDMGIFQKCMKCNRTVCLYHDGHQMIDRW
jgi:hypothetical protein